MPVQRHFLGWDAPVTVKVRSFLLPEPLQGSVDLERDLIVVPTRQAGRRLREALALFCADHGGALLSARLVTPSFFFGADSVPDVASDLDVRAVWADVISRAAPDAYPSLFPGRVPSGDYGDALRTGEMIQSMRNALVEGGYRIADVVALGVELNEADRWNDLVRLESVYLEKLARLGLKDPCQAMLARASDPECPEGVERVVLAAVPDPAPLMIRAMETLASRLDIHILIHAPPSLLRQFDAWGRPAAEPWQSARLRIPEPEKNLKLAGSPLAQTQIVLRLMAEENERYGPGDTAIGVPDRELASVLTVEFGRRGLNAFDPAGKSPDHHVLFHLLDAWGQLIAAGSYASAAAFLRHPDVLAFLSREQDVSPAPLLDELDVFQNMYLPLELDDVTRRLTSRPASTPHADGAFPNLARAVSSMQGFLRIEKGKGIEPLLRAMLQAIYRGRPVRAGDPDDDEFVTVARLVDSALHELGDARSRAMAPEPELQVRLLLRVIREQRYTSERGGAHIDLEGWLELPWNDAPFLIVTGMNEGIVPASQPGDVFLPDSLRRQLGLRHEGDRMARDAYLMASLLASREAQGRVGFVAGKTSARGDPLKPSRLLFACDDEELPRRARRLFGSPEEDRIHVASSVSFRLDPSPPPDLPAAARAPRRLSVTQFSDYLACPFRFYLAHILGMEPLDDTRRELDALDFGSLIHYALERMAADRAARRSTDPMAIREQLWAEADAWCNARFGSKPPLPVAIQIETAKRRLAAAARAQADLATQGWEIARTETKISVDMGGIAVVGQIDRIDRHGDTGAVRLLDYKSSDTAADPREAHVGPPAPAAPAYAQLVSEGKPARWLDLQLPLYRILIAASGEFSGPCEVGYFNLPKAASETGVALWEGFSEEIVSSARACAEGVIRDVLARRFWPPAEKVLYDDFETLFPGPVADYVEVEKFLAEWK